MAVVNKFLLFELCHTIVVKYICTYDIVGLEMNKESMEEKNMSELKEIREKVLVNIKEVAGQHKEKIEDAYKRVMKLECIARREGLLALEYEAELIPKETLLCNQLAEMIELVVDGTDSQVICQIHKIRCY